MLPEPNAPRIAAPSTVHSRSRVTLAGLPMMSVMIWTKPSDFVPPPVSRKSVMPPSMSLSKESTTMRISFAQPSSSARIMSCAVVIEAEPEKAAARGGVVVRRHLAGQEGMEDQALGADRRFAPILSTMIE